MRFPSILVGLFLGVGLSVVTSRFEEVLARNVHLTFFIPFVVYMADAVGTQTQAIYTRDLKTTRANFHRYLMKEAILGMIIGAIASAAAAVFTFIWFGSADLTKAVSFAMFMAIASAPIVALLVTQILQIERTDPAVGAGPIATVIQDAISVVIFGLIASAIILP